MKGWTLFTAPPIVAAVSRWVAVGQGDPLDKDNNHRDTKARRRSCRGPVGSWPGE